MTRTDLPRWFKLKERQILKDLLPPAQAAQFARIAIRYYAKFGATPPAEILALLAARGISPMTPS